MQPVTDIVYAHVIVILLFCNELKVNSVSVPEMKLLLIVILSHFHKCMPLPEELFAHCVA